MPRQPKEGEELVYMLYCGMRMSDKNKLMGAWVECDKGILGDKAVRFPLDVKLMLWDKLAKSPVVGAVYSFIKITATQELYSKSFEYVGRIANQDDLVLLRLRLRDREAKDVYAVEKQRKKDKEFDPLDKHIDAMRVAYQKCNTTDGRAMFIARLVARVTTRGV